MIDRHDQLFSDSDLSDCLHAITRSIPQHVDSVPKDQFLVSTDGQLVDHFVSKFTIEPLQLYEDRKEMDQVETQVDVSGLFGRDWGHGNRTGPLMVPGSRVDVSIPFTGDFKLWKLKPSTWRTTSLRAQVRPPSANEPGAMVFTVENPHDVEPKVFKQELDRLLNDVRFYVENSRKEVEKFNKGVAQHVRTAVNARRERLIRHEGLSEVLNIPLRRREGVPDIEPIRVEKRITTPLPTPPKSGFKPEPGIADELYETILKIIRHEGRTFEAMPRTFAVHDEQGLRDIILAHLNGHFEGGATAETFRKLGKTDIRIEDEERAAFIAECKIWRGPKALDEALDQLFGYLTWRDCKAALIVFNKGVAGFSGLLEKVPGQLALHPLLVKDLGSQGAGEWRYLFRSKEDEARQINLHVFLFNIFVRE